MPQNSRKSIALASMPSISGKSWQKASVSIMYLSGYFSLSSHRRRGMLPLSFRSNEQPSLSIAAGEENSTAVSGCRIS